MQFGGVRVLRGDPSLWILAGLRDVLGSFQELPQDSVADIQAAYAALDAALDDLLESAPEELVEDLTLLADTADDLVTEAADATTVEEAMAAAQEVFAGEDFNAAAERVDTYFGERCPEANQDQAPANGAEAPEIEEVEPATTEG